MPKSALSKSSRLWLPACLLALLGGSASLSAEQVSQVGAAKIAWEYTGKGKPTVVFQSGLGDGLSTWAAVLHKLAGNVSTFAYDRPGYGASSPAPVEARNPCAIATELRELLRAAAINPPYLLVGHSLGGQYQYAFARLFPQDVAGMLLLDPTHPDHWTAMQQQARAQASLVSGLRTLVFSTAMRSEFDGQAVCLESARVLPKRFPIRILASTRFELTDIAGFRSMVQHLQQDWLALLPGASLSPVDGAGHYIQKDRADVVSTEIRSLLSQAGLTHN